MSEFNISIPGGESRRLMTGGKFCKDNIVVTAEGGSAVPVEEKDVNFYNYNGKLMYSYTLEEVQALTELPPPPRMDRDFLMFEEWNWSLEDIKALNLPLSVMATVCPSDGSTKAVLEITDSRIATAKMYIQQASGTLSVDWGDGSEPTTFAAATNTYRTLEHTYAAAGEYIVTISTGGSCYLGHGNAEKTFLYGRQQFLTEVYLGKNANVSARGLYNHHNCSVVTFSLGVTGINDSALSYMSRLEVVSLPSTTIRTGSYAIHNSSILRVFSFPAAFTSHGYYAFPQTNGVRSITIPPKSTGTGTKWNSIPKVYFAEGIKNISGETLSDGIQRTIEIPSTAETIGGLAIARCNYMEKLVFKPLVPPTVANANAFGIPAYCIVEVPAASLEAYQNATNYAGIAAQMVGV